MLKIVLALSFLTFSALTLNNAIAQTVRIPGHTIAQQVLVLPIKGDTMDVVNEKFGSPNTSTEPVGTPPISQWQYHQFTVFFEDNIVIHAINLNTLIAPQE